MREESNDWQTGDGQEYVPSVSADCGCLKTFSLITTHFPVNLRLREGFQSQRGSGHQRKPISLLHRRTDRTGTYYVARFICPI